VTLRIVSFCGSPALKDPIDQRRYKNNQENEEMKDEVENGRERKTGKDDREGDESRFSSNVRVAVP